MNTLLEKAVNWFKSFEIDVSQVGDTLYVNQKSLMELFGSQTVREAWNETFSELSKTLNTRAFAWVGVENNCLKITVL